MSTQYVADARRSGVFWMHDAILDQYAEKIGVYGVAVYALLCRRANSEKRCWPSLNSMARTLSISRSKLVSTLDTLEEQGLVAREQRQEEGKGHASTVYILLDPDTLVRTENNPCSSGEQALVLSVHPKEYTIEGSHKEGEKTSQKDVANNKVTYITDKEVLAATEVLMAMSRWEKDKASTLALVNDTKQSYPAVNVLAVSEDLAYKVRNKMCSNYSKPSRAFGTWVQRQARHTDTQHMSGGQRGEEPASLGPMGRRNLTGGGA